MSSRLIGARGETLGSTGRQSRTPEEWGPISPGKVANYFISVYNYKNK